MSLSHITECNLCKQKFTQDSPIVGENDAARAQRMLNKLAKHILQLHPNEWAKCEQQGKATASFEAICLFQFQDPWLNQFRDAMRHAFHFRYTAYRVEDSKIVEMVTALGLPDEFLQRVINSHLSLRNILQEIPPATTPQNGQPITA